MTALESVGSGVRVGIVCDSVACVPQSLAQALGIEVVPIWIQFGEESLRDGIDIAPQEVYRRLRAGETATTSAPSPGDFVEAFRRMADRGFSEVVAITLPAELTGTFRNASLAAQTSPVPVRVVDSRTAGAAEGWVAVEAARAAAAGAGADEVVARAHFVSQRARLFAMVPELQYLRRGGRAVQALAKLGAALGVVPVLALRNGHVEPLAVCRSREAAFDRIVGEVASDARRGRLHLAVMEADAAPEAERLARTLAEELHPAELFITAFTPAMGAHAGPGILGVGYWIEPRAA